MQTYLENLHSFTNKTFAGFAFCLIYNFSESVFLNLYFITYHQFSPPFHCLWNGEER